MYDENVPGAGLCDESGAGVDSQVEARADKAWAADLVLHRHKLEAVVAVWAEEEKDAIARLQDDQEKLGGQW